MVDKGDKDTSSAKVQDEREKEWKRDTARRRLRETKRQHANRDDDHNDGCGSACALSFLATMTFGATFAKCGDFSWVWALALLPTD